MIQQLADRLTYGLLGLEATSGLGSALNFFIYDSAKILLLLFAISALMGVVNAYFPIERLRNYLMTHRLYGLQYLLASVFGAITPFCSCSSIRTNLVVVLPESMPRYTRTCSPAFGS